MVSFGSKIFIAVWLLGFVLTRHHVGNRMDTPYLLGSETFPCWELTSSIPHTVSRAFSQTWKSVERTAHHWKQVEDTFQMDRERVLIAFSVPECFLHAFVAVLHIDFSLFINWDTQNQLLPLETKKQKKTVFEIHMITQ